MDCERTRIAISAHLDGEDPGIPAAAVETHLASCRACRRYAVEAESLHRSMRVAPAPPVPDLTPAILGRLGEARTKRARHDPVLRLALAVLGAVQLAVAVPALLGADGEMPVHAARHLGSFGLALAVGFLFVAWRPSRVTGLLPVVAALVACLVGTSALDLLAGRTAAGSEATHVTEVAGLVVTWLLARPGTVRRARLAA